MTKIKLFQLRLFRTIRRQICSIDMIDIETFTNIFRLLNHVDRSIIEKYIQGYSKNLLQMNPNIPKHLCPKESMYSRTN